MSENTKKEKTITVLAECAIMLALSIVLSFISVYEMPMGGKITLFSMLPVCLISVKYGPRHGLGVAALYMLFQLAESLVKGNVFIYTTGIIAVLICVLFDYVFPFTCLGFAGLFRKKGNTGIIAGITLAVVFRFVCHFVTGVVIWGQWAPEGMGKYLYSLIYNGQYMLPELIITVIIAAILINIPQMRKLLGLPAAKKREENN